jgi:hypothetical protein
VKLSDLIANKIYGKLGFKVFRELTSYYEVDAVGLRMELALNNTFYYSFQSSAVSNCYLVLSVA